jgi:hypothetical protein
MEIGSFAEHKTRGKTEKSTIDLAQNNEKNFYK